MNVADELTQLDSADVSESQILVQKWRKRLNEARDPETLWELIDYQLATQSTHTLKILTALKDLHSQDFFAKINDCLHKATTSLPALRLLAHMLAGQASWLYKIVHSSVFPTLLQLLKPAASNPVILTSAVYVLCAIIPITPYHITPHLPDIFETFTQIATLSVNDIQRKIPREIFLGIKAAIFFLFLQLYALYPCSLVSYLKGRFGPTGEIQVYLEHISPLFNHVQLHPNLITELPSLEMTKTRWRSQDPNEVATLALSFCVDPSLVSMETSATPLNKLQEELIQSTANYMLSDNNTSSVLLPFEMQLSGSLASNHIWSSSFVQEEVAPSPSCPSRYSDDLPPLSDPSSLNGSLQTTPVISSRIINRPSYFNYSPTASLDNTSVGVAMGGAPLVQKNDTPSTNIPSGSNSPLTQSTETSKSLREKLSSVFKRKRDDTTPHTIKEDFTNISLSDFSISNKGKFDTNIAKSCSAKFECNKPQSSPDNIRELFVENEKSSSRSNSSSSNDAELSSLIVQQSFSTQSFPNLNILQATAKLEKLATSEESCALSTPQDKTTPFSDDDNNMPVLISRTVSKEKKQLSGPSLNYLSPVGALDLFIQTGQVLHHSFLGDLPLPDLEGVEWDHYGSCPHSEELVTVNNMMAMLHSQLLFERHQCQTHAKKNRQLMTKARNAIKLENEVVVLRQRLYQQQQLIDCMKNEQSELEKKLLLATRSTLETELKTERDKVKSLTQQLQKGQQKIFQLQMKNSQLTKELYESNGAISTLEHEIGQMKSKLNEVDKLKNEIQSLTKEHLILEELYHQQQLTLTTLRTEHTQTQQLNNVNESLVKEKETALNSRNVWKKEVMKLQMLLKENQAKIQEKDSLIDSMRNLLQLAQDTCKEKIQSVESKYQTIKSINHQLELKILEIKSQSSTGTL